MVLATNFPSEITNYLFLVNSLATENTTLAFEAQSLYLLV